MSGSINKEVRLKKYEKVDGPLKSQETMQQVSHLVRVQLAMTSLPTHLKQRILQAFGNVKVVCCRKEEIAIWNV